MALEQITFNIGAFNDADASGNNYFAGEVYEVFNTNDTLADIFSDAAGANPINQDGISNKSNASGEVVFYIDAGSYYVLSGGKRRDFKNQPDLNARYNPSTVQSLLDSTELNPDGGEVFDVQGYYEAGVGGGRWHSVVAGVSVGINYPNSTWIRQCVGVPTLALVLQDDTGNILKYGAVDGGADSSISFQAAIDRLNKWHIPQGVEIFAKEIILKDGTYGRNEGVLKLVDNQPEWARVFTNSDKVNGDVGVVIDNTGGLLHGNRDSQSGAIVQHFGLFINCRDFEIFGGKMGYNKADEVTPSNSPDGQFNQGVAFGEGVSTNPTVGFISYMGGRNNHTHDFVLVDWAQEGISTRWNTDSSTTNFKAINGPENDEPYYAPVTFGSRAGTVTVAINDTVLVQEFHEYGGVEQQPHLIYKALVAGTYDLNSEDYTDAARWALVNRDISLDLGYTAARHAGAKGKMNLIAHGYAAYCRAASFSSDSPMNGMHDLYSYHNSYQPGINFGHSNTGSDSSVASNLTSINAGWAGGTGGSGYGINLVGATKGAKVSGFYICGAARNGVNQSDSGAGNYLINGTVKWSGAGGIKSQSQLLTCDSVASQFNAGDDFEPGGAGKIRLIGCEDSRGETLNNERMLVASASFKEGQTQRTLVADGVGVSRDVFASNFNVPASTSLVTITFTDAIVSDSFIFTMTYTERNGGSGAVANQYAARATFLVGGTGTSRGILQLDAPFSNGRQFRADWNASGVLSVFLQNNTPEDVGAVNLANTILINVQSANLEFEVGIGG